MTVPAVVALDVGGTVLKGIVSERDGTVLHREQRPTEAAAGPDAVVAAITRFAGELSAVPGADTVAAGVVVPGVVDASAGIARYSSNIGWRDVALRAVLEDALGLPVALDHDVRTGGLAEARLGAATGTRNSLFVPVGTGIAGAVVLDGHAYAGAGGAAGEIGHVIVRGDGEPCPCGQRGCVETYASAAAISRRYEQRTGRAATADAVVTRLHTDPDARAVWDEAIDALALGLVAAIMLVDPELVVIGGGLAAAGEVLFEPLRRRVADRLSWHVPPPMVPAVLGADAGRYGAALIAWDLVDARAVAP